MSKLILDDIASGYNLSKINSNFQKIEDELNDKVLYRDNPGGEPNNMSQNLDMNGHKILNVGDGGLESDAINLRQAKAILRVGGGADKFNHNDTLNRNAVGAHDDIYRRKTTVAEIQSGVFSGGCLLSVSDRDDAPFNIEPTGSYIINGFNILNAGTGKVAVLQTYASPINFRFFVPEGIVDASDALQAALDTGLDIYNYDQTPITISKIMQSKRNKLIGEWIINPTRAAISGLGQFTFSSNVNESQPDTMKLVYCLKIYDLIEMMYLRSMGINFILHAGALWEERPDLPDLKAALELALDNAMSSDLKVNMTTGYIVAEDYMAVEYVNYFKDHPSVWGFSVYDEPTFNNVSVSMQDQRIDTLRALTTKNLNFVDVIQNYSLYKYGHNPFSTKYDTVFVDAYCHNNPIGGTVAEKVARDLHDFRVAAGAAKLFFPKSEIVPVCGLFLHTGFTESIDQIELAYRDFAKIGNGAVGMWAWDASEPNLTFNIRSSEALRNLAKSYCKFFNTGTKLPEAKRFGVRENVNFQPSSNPDGLNLVMRPQFVSSGGTSHAAFGVIRNGANSEFSSTDISTNGEIGGLFFKTQFPFAVLDTEPNVYTSISAGIFDVGAQSIGSLGLYYTQDNGRTFSPVVNSQSFNLAPPNQPEKTLDYWIGSGTYWRGSKLTFIIDFNALYYTDYYRFGIYGYIVTSDW